MSTLIYSFLSLPDPPEQIIDQAYHAYEEKKKIGFIETNLHQVPGHKEYRTREVCLRDGSRLNSIESYRYWISEDFEHWIKDHVQQETLGCGINVFEDGELVAPHVDANRNFSIQYILETGGDSVETAWYRQKGKDILRPDIRHVFDLDKIVLDYNQLEELDRICFPAKTWVCLSTNILHAVENLQGRRLALQISCQDAPDHIKYLQQSII